MSIRGLIVDNVKTTLEGITTANGYNQDVKYVSSENLKAPDELTIEQKPSLQIIDGDEDKNAADVDSLECFLEIVITGYLERINDADPLQARLRNLMNDTEKALMVDETRGSKAIKTDVTKLVTDKGVLEPHAMFDMTIMVKYFHNRKDPSSQSNSPI